MSQHADAARMQEVCTGPLWLRAASENMSGGGGVYFAYSGYIAWTASGHDPMLDLLRNPQPRPEAAASWNGHYAFFHADTSRNTLRLFRDHSGGERLYHARIGDLVLFANSIKPLLAHPGISKRIDPELAAEFVLSGNASVVFGNGTLCQEISELLPGEMLSFSNGKASHDRSANPLLGQPRESAPSHTPRKLRQALLNATRAAIGREEQVAVLLSGGLDCSAIAVLAVESLGAKNVHAFTYEFEEADHPSETQYAALVARELGISHRIVKISYQDYWDAIPELVWRLESPRTRLGAQLLTTRAIKETGLKRALTGIGMEHLLGIYQHDHFINRLNGLLREPNLERVLENWMRQCFGAGSSLAVMSSPHVSPDSAPPELYYLILCLLRHNGMIEDVSRYYPEDLKALLRQTSESERVRKTIEGVKHLPFDRQVRSLVFDYYTSLHAIKGKTKAWEDAGVHTLSPSLFFDCISESDRFSRPKPDLNDSSPYKHLLIEAMRDSIPEVILSRPKIVEQSPAPKAWQKKFLQAMKPLVSKPALDFNPHFKTGQTSLENNYFGALALLGLWSTLFINPSSNRHPPTWKSLGL